MPYLPIDLRAFAWDGGAFKPTGKVYQFGPSLSINPVEVVSKAYAARIVVGFNVGKRPTWRMADIIHFVKI